MGRRGEMGSPGTPGLSGENGEKGSKVWSLQNHPQEYSICIIKLMPSIIYAQTPCI